jgi:hypothetical protein
MRYVRMTHRFLADGLYNYIFATFTKGRGRGRERMETNKIITIMACVLSLVLVACEDSGPSAKKASPPEDTGPKTLLSYWECDRGNGAYFSIDLSQADYGAGNVVDYVFVDSQGGRVECTYDITLFGVEEGGDIDFVYVSIDFLSYHEDDPVNYPMHQMYCSNPGFYIEYELFNEVLRLTSANGSEVYCE